MLKEKDYRWICSSLEISMKDILRVYRNPHSGMNNDTFVLETVRGAVMYRVAGRGTERFCSRERERYAYEHLAGCGLTDELLACDPATGAKLTVYHPGSRTCNPHDAGDVKRAMALLKRLHSLPVVLEGRDDPYGRLCNYIQIAKEAGSALECDAGFISARAGVDALADPLKCPEAELRPVHADALAGNYLFRPDGSDILIDFEFASMGCIYGDLADFAHDANLSDAECLNLLGVYLGQTPNAEQRERFYTYCACVALMWSAWAAYKARTERDKVDFFEGYYAQSVQFALRSLKMRRGQG